MKGSSDWELKTFGISSREYEMEYKTKEILEIQTAWEKIGSNPWVGKEIINILGRVQAFSIKRCFLQELLKSCTNQAKLRN